MHGPGKTGDICSMKEKEVTPEEKEFLDLLSTYNSRLLVAVVRS